MLIILPAFEVHPQNCPIPTPFHPWDVGSWQCDPGRVSQAQNETSVGSSVYFSPLGVLSDLLTLLLPITTHMGLTRCLKEPWAWYLIGWSWVVRVGCSSRRAAWSPDPTGQVSCSRLSISFPWLYKNGLLEWRWHVGLWTLRYRTTSGLSLLTNPWAWTLCKGPCTSCCPHVFHQTASWNLPYPGEE